MLGHARSVSVYNNSLYQELSPAPTPMNGWLFSTLIMLFATVAAMVACRSLKLPAILGYLLVGVVIGPHALAWVPSTEDSAAVAEFGVVFLMFTLGLEFSLSKLKSMRKVVLGLGGLQVLLTSLALFLLGLAVGANWRVSIGLGGALAMSSTAIVSKLLTERLELHSAHAHNSIGVLLFQDLAVIPLLVVIPSLADPNASLGLALAMAALKAGLVLSVLLVFGQDLLRPWFHLVARQRSSELFTINVLLVTLAVAYLTELAGLSLALGAFIAGMLISETEFRYQVEDDIKPFRDVLLGLFFITVGMKLDFASLPQHLGQILLFVLALVPLKALILAGLGRILGYSPGVSTRTALTLAQAGEFGFVILALIVKELHPAAELEQILLASMLLSMLFAPFIIQNSDRVVARFIGSEWLTQSTSLHQVASRSFDMTSHVILCGFGRTGQSLGRFLRQESIRYFALDMDAERVRKAAAGGDSVVFGDASKREVLVAAGLMRARALVVTYSDTPSALRILAQVQAMRPDLPVVVRTQDDVDIDRLRDAGAVEVVAEVMEGSLMLASHALMLLGVPLNRVLKCIREAREERYHVLRGFLRQGDDTGDEPGAEPLLHTVTLPETAYAVGQTLGQLDLNRYKVEIKAIKRHKVRRVSLDGDSRLQSGDMVMLVGSQRNIHAAEQRLIHGA